MPERSVGGGRPRAVSGRKSGNTGLHILKYLTVAVPPAAVVLNPPSAKGAGWVCIAVRKGQNRGDMPEYPNAGAIASWRPEEQCQGATYAAPSVLIRQLPIDWFYGEVSPTPVTGLRSAPNRMFEASVTSTRRAQRLLPNRVHPIWRRS
jgi:hypothetical protein